MTGIRNLVTRTQWGALPAKSRTPQRPDAVRFLVVHYSAMDADEQALHRNCASRVRAIQRYHMTSDQLAPGGASDIGYTWVVCKHGYVFKGRGWRVMPAATGGANAFTVAVCFLGNDTVGRDDVTDKGRRAIRSVLEFCLRNAPRLEGVRGHRDFGSTACPGNELYRLVKQLDLEVRQD